MQWLKLTQPQVWQALHLDDRFEAWKVCWDQSAATATGAMDWLGDPQAVEKACASMGVNSDLTQAFVQASREVTAQPPLARLLWHLHYLVWMRPGMATATPRPPLPESCGSARHMFYALMYLLALPRAASLHAMQGIDPAVTRATLGDIGVWMQEYHQRHGCYGLVDETWPAIYFGGRLFALGRLQFELVFWNMPFYAFVNDANGEHAFMVAQGWALRDDGQFADADAPADPHAATAWTTLRVTPDAVTGHCVNAEHGVDNKPRTLPGNLWRCILRPGDPVLAVHIPATGALRDDDAMASYRQALSFFSTHFPQHRFTALTCHSWLMDGQLGRVLDAQSNIARFQRRFNLLPAPAADQTQTLNRVFQAPPRTASAALPRVTHLQQRMAAYMDQGGRWRIGLGVITRTMLEQM